jgi:hypothetical protein
MNASDEIILNLVFGFKTKKEKKLQSNANLAFVGPKNGMLRGARETMRRGRRGVA